MANGNEPAHPISEEMTDRVIMDIRIYTGLTRREHFAAMAMQGLCASGFLTDRRLQQQSEDIGIAIDFRVAVSALTIADALIDVLNDPHFSETKNQQ